jgi:signal transduction histidine kinase
MTALRRAAAKLRHRIRHPRTTVRWRLTAMYGGLFLTTGAVLLATTYLLVSKATVSDANIAGPGAGLVYGGSALVQTPPRGRLDHSTITRQVKVPTFLRRALRSRTGQRVAQFVGSDQRIADLHVLVIESIVALAIMAVVSTALGWLVAGWVLAPLRAMADTTRDISAASLDRRLAMEGPQDELKQLSDTIDGLLERLEASFDAQRRFVANASHELRTPLTAARAMLEMVLSDPAATIETFRETCSQVLDEGEQQEELIEALLALAQGQRGIDRRELVDLAVVASSVLDRYELEAMTRSVEFEAQLSPARLSGDRRLIERLITNLLQNALRHNDAGGDVKVSVRERAGSSVLTISNTGPVVPANTITTLTQPFQRLAPDRTGHRDGLGLGLSIVEAIANAHDATLELEPRDGGGLEVTVRFPRAVVQPANDPAPGQPAAAAVSPSSA